MKPYSDEYMIYDFETHRYILTIKDVTNNLGIDLTVRVKNDATINALLRQISIQVYNFIHEHNVNTQTQDYIIATTRGGRNVIKLAMEEQLKYVLTVGDLTRSTDLNKRALWFDLSAANILLSPIPEIGTPIIYQGNLPCVRCKEVW